MSEIEIKPEMRFKTPKGDVVVADRNRLIILANGYGIWPALAHWMFNQGMLTPVREPIRIELDDWVPREGDLIRWPGPAEKDGERFESRVYVGAGGHLRVTFPSGGAPYALETLTLSILRAACVEIWRPQA